MKFTPLILSAAVLLSASLVVNASSTIPLSTLDLVRASDAVFRGTVVGSKCFKDAAGLIYTRTSLRVDEGLKGKFPSVLAVVHRGGQVGNEDDFCGLSPRFQSGGEYLMFLLRSPDGTLQSAQGHASAFLLQRLEAPSAQFAASGQAMLDEVRRLTQDGKISGADVTDQAGQSGGPAPASLTGMLGGTASRYLAPDRGEPIVYLVDTNGLPAGITVTQATNAIQQALNAWLAVTSLKFKFGGFQSFNPSADSVVNGDEKLRIQLHDNFNHINTAGTLGIGGRNAISSVPSSTTWDLGGNVNGNEFRKTGNGYVVLETTNTSMQTLATFTEVLCHEIGHALNMAHSTEVVTTDAYLTNAIMYFQAHRDGRGATLGAYDPPVIQQVYPANTPPFGFNRVMDVISAQNQPSVPGVNEIQVCGFDLQTTNLTVTLANATAYAGAFSVSGNKISFTPDDWYTDSGRLDPTGSSIYESTYARVSDGTNASPWFKVRVMSFSSDGDYPTSDGLPDYWMQNCFGHADPRANDQSQASDDKDGDGFTNLQEYLAGTKPTDASSCPRILSLNAGTLQFTGKPYELYAVVGSTNLTNWSIVPAPVLPTNAPSSVLTDLLADNISLSASNLPTTGPKMFFRLQKVP